MIPPWDSPALLHSNASRLQKEDTNFIIGRCGKHRSCTVYCRKRTHRSVWPASPHKDGENSQSRYFRLSLLFENSAARYFRG